MIRKDTKIVRLSDGDFYIDIVDAGDFWEAWLAHYECGVMELMCGWPKVQRPNYTMSGEAEIWDFDRFCKLVEANLNSYEEAYINEYLEV